MRSSEILRGLADMLDKMSGEESETPASDEHLGYIANANIENAEKAEAAKDELGVFIPPLQQKIELLKKSVGVDNYYDEEGSDQCGCDDLDIIKKNAGINPNIAAIMTLSDDEPMDN